MYIQISNLTKSFKMFKRSAGLKGALKSFINRKYSNFFALKNISLKIDKGEIVGILGENGAGKTTLIKLMVGLLHPTEGEVVIDGYNPWQRSHKYLSNVAIVMKHHDSDEKHKHPTGEINFIYAFSKIFVTSK